MLSVRKDSKAKDFQIPSTVEKTKIRSFHFLGHGAFTIFGDTSKYSIHHCWICLSSLDGTEKDI